MLLGQQKRDNQVQVQTDSCGSPWDLHTRDFAAVNDLLERQMNEPRFNRRKLLHCALRVAALSLLGGTGDRRLCLIILVSFNCGE